MKNAIDIALIKQMRHLKAQADEALNELSSLSGITVTLDIDNVTTVRMWRSTQTSEIKTKNFKITIYNN